MTTKTLPDGRIFPFIDDEILSWSLSYNSLTDERANYTRMRAVIRAMIEHRPEQLERERKEMLKASFDRMFGRNAEKVLKVIDQELERTAILARLEVSQ